MRLFPAAFVALACCAAVSAQTAAWTYEGKNGPLNWGKLDPAYEACGKGREQAPIDIRGARLNKGLSPLEFHYRSGGVTLENNGNTIVAHVHPGSYMVSNGMRYELQAFEFHHPGEIAVKGKLNDMDVELVHKSTDGKYVVVEVRFQMDRGQANPLMALLWQHLPQKAGATEKIDDLINPAAFFPSDPGYWTFAGSLSTPPCTEGTTWFVYQDPIPMSLGQLRDFSALFKISSRELQDAHGRKIDASE